MRQLDCNLTVHGITIKENKHVENNLVKNHYHPYHQILYVLEGQGEIQFGSERQRFTQNHLALICPYSNHSTIATSKLTMLALEFNIELLGMDVKEMLEAYNFNSTRLIQLNLFEAGEIRQLLRRLIYEQSQSQSIKWRAMKIYFAELLLILIRSKDEIKIKDANVLRAERLRKYIDTRYYEAINPDHIAIRVGLTPRHINTIFKEEYGVTPMQYLSSVRMEVAQKLLIETSKDIPSICFEIGFESLSTFYRLFKKLTKLSPNKYRTAFQSTNENEMASFAIKK